MYRKTRNSINSKKCLEYLKFIQYRYYTENSLNYRKLLYSGQNPNWLTQMAWILCFGAWGLRFRIFLKICPFYSRFHFIFDEILKGHSFVICLKISSFRQENTGRLLSNLWLDKIMSPKPL